MQLSDEQKSIIERVIMPLKQAKPMEIMETYQSTKMDLMTYLKLPTAGLRQRNMEI